MPADATLPFSDREVRPQDRSGVVVRFPIHLTHGALLTLVAPKRQTLPIGSTAMLTATGAVVPVGYDGEAFIEDLRQRDNALVVVRPDGQSCTVAFKYHAVPGEIPTIGPLMCQESKP